MEEQDAEQQIKKLKEQGYKSLEDKDRKERLLKALREYDNHIMNPYG